MVFSLLLAALATSTPTNGPSEVEMGFVGALRGCEEWILNPASWIDGPKSFVETVGLGNKMGLVDTVPDVSLPPKNLRLANHYWRINSTEDAGYFLVVSDRLPMCHLTGGGNTDLQPVVESVVASKSFVDRWEPISNKTIRDMVSRTYRNRVEPKLSLTVSNANKPKQRRDRVQVLATATFSTSN